MVFILHTFNYNYNHYLVKFGLVTMSSLVCVRLHISVESNQLAISVILDDHSSVHDKVICTTDGGYSDEHFRWINIDSETVIPGSVYFFSNTTLKDTSVFRCVFTSITDDSLFIAVKDFTFHRSDFLQGIYSYKCNSH